MEGRQLFLRCPQCVGGIIADPQIDWSFDDLISELNTIDQKLQASSFTKTHSSDSLGFGHAEKNRKSFVIRVSDDEGDYDDDEENNSRQVAMGNRFTCEDIFLSDDVDSDSKSISGTQWSLMDKGGVIEGALLELSHEHQLSVAEEIRNRISAFGTDITNEKEKLNHALSRAEKSKEARHELDRKRDLQYQRQIAEELDNHLTDVQRHHEYKSQIQEKKIRDDAAIEDSKRKQKAFHEEKNRQEKMKAEEAKYLVEKKKEEEAKAAALEAERAAKEAADVAAAESQKKAADALTAVSKGSGSDGLNKAPEEILRGAESALKMEERRILMYNEMFGKDFAFQMNSNEAYRRQSMQMARRIKNITGTKQNVRAKADELLNLINSTLSQSVNIGLFAEKIVSQCTTAANNSVLYGYGHVIVMVTSQFPVAMEILIAKLNSVCIFTVPKYLSYSKAAFQSIDDHQRAIGFQEVNGVLESKDTYLERLNKHMKFYGALIQTEVNGIQNLHGIEEGWKWLARFLNDLPANVYTVVALEAFIELAGFALYKKYKNQFKKLLNIILRVFLKALKERVQEPKVTLAMRNLEEYIQSNKFQKEPEGWRLLESSTKSSEFNPNESDNQQQYHHNSSGGGYRDYHQNYNNNSSNRFVYRR